MLLSQTWHFYSIILEFIDIFLNLFRSIRPRHNKRGGESKITSNFVANDLHRGPEEAPVYRNKCGSLIYVEQKADAQK